MAITMQLASSDKYKMINTSLIHLDNMRTCTTAVIRRLIEKYFLGLQFCIFKPGTPAVVSLITKVPEYKAKFYALLYVP